MRTDPFQDDLKAYLDGELSWSRRLAVRRHLTRCASCREEISQMTQIAEDLRTSEQDAALEPALRAKILNAVPGTGSAGLFGESRSATEELPSTGLSSVPEALSPGRPALPVPGRHRTRPALAWAIAGLALVVWFVCYPLFLHTHTDAGAGYAPMTESAPSMPAAESQVVSRAFKQEAEPSAAYDARPAPVMHVAKPSPLNALPPGAVQTLDASNPPAQFRSLPVSGTEEPLRQVHKEATIGVQVPNPEATSDTVENMVKETGGYVASNTLNTGDDGLKTAELTVKVPVTQFETFMGQLAKLGNVQSKNISGEDITEKTSDADQTENVLETDVTNSEERLKALGAKAKWGDQEATRELRIQLAQARARLVLLKRLAALSTITIDLTQTPPKAPPPAPVTGGFLNGLKRTTHDALQSLMGSASALLALAIWLLAYAPIWVPLFFIGRYALREYRKRVAA